MQSTQQGIFKTIESVPSLLPQQTKVLTGIHQAGDHDIVALCRIDTNTLFNVQSKVIILNLSKDLTVVAMRQNVSSDDKGNNHWMGSVLSVNDGRYSSVSNCPSDARFTLTINGSDVFGELEIGNDKFSIMPVGEAMHVICVWNKRNAA
ncbi:MAG: hypothetical protein AAGB12_06075 [Pseudomonadota bacterium]